MTANRPPRPTPNDRELHLWKVGRALAVTFVAAVLVAGGVFYGLVVLLDFREIDRTAKLDAATLFDLVKLASGWSPGPARSSPWSSPTPATRQPVNGSTTNTAAGYSSTPPTTPPDQHRHDVDLTIHQPLPLLQRWEMCLDAQARVYETSPHLIAHSYDGVLCGKGDR